MHVLVPVCQRKLFTVYLYSKIHEILVGIALFPGPLKKIRRERAWYARSRE